MTLSSNKFCFHFGVYLLKSIFCLQLGVEYSGPIEKFHSERAQLILIMDGHSGWCSSENEFYLL